jgi:hypothetical protein
MANARARMSYSSSPVRSKQHEKCVSVSGGAVTQATAFFERTGAPRQLAATERDLFLEAP